MRYSPCFRHLGVVPGGGRHFPNTVYTFCRELFMINVFHLNSANSTLCIRSTSDSHESQTILFQRGDDVIGILISGGFTAEVAGGAILLAQSAHHGILDAVRVSVPAHLTKHHHGRQQ
jgi:hypothetical protein